MKREKAPYPYPECMGWYTPCETCDGIDGEPQDAESAPCAAREGCRMLLLIMGGESLRDSHAVEETKEAWPAHRVAWGLKRDKLPEPPKRSEHPRPSLRSKYHSALIVMDTIVERAADEAGLRVVDETLSYKRINDVWIRYHKSEQSAGLYWMTPGREKVLVGTFIFLVNRHRLNLKVCCADIESAYALRPPKGVSCRLWNEGEKMPCTTLVGVEPETAISAGKWLARMIASNLIGVEL